MTMTNNLRTETRAGALEENQSAVSWAAIAAGAVATAALTLLLLAFGAGIGFSTISPWSNSGISSETFKIATGIYLIVVAMLASTIGGYVAGRLRTKWAGVQSDEVAFRDTAHGFLAWAFAAVLGSAVLGGAATYLVGGAAQGAAQGAAASLSSGGANEYFVDMLLRPNPAGQSAPTPQGGSDATLRREIGRIFARSLREDGGLSVPDRTYLVQLVASRSGVDQAEANKRVSDAINQAKVAADEARSAAAKTALWLTAAMLIGGLCRPPLSRAGSCGTADGTASSAEKVTGLNEVQLRETTMGYILLWLIGIPIPILILLALLHH